mgnify:CR=1 FL=1
MIKIRLEGTPEELDKAILHLEADEQLYILNISGFYPNTRGRRSDCGRIYIDVCSKSKAKTISFCQCRRKVVHFPAAPPCKKARRQAKKRPQLAFSYSSPP